MHILIELILREGAFLALLVALGAGPAAYLSTRFDAAARVAMTPVLGFCTGSALATTLTQFFPADDTYWVLVLAAVASVAVSYRRTRPGTGAASLRSRLGRREVAQVVLVCLAVAGPLSFTLLERNTVGPGDFYFTDGVSYVSETDGLRTTSTEDAAAAWIRIAVDGHGRFANLTQYNWAYRASYNQNLDAAPLEANADALLGLGASDTYDPFLIVILLAGGLGAFAALRYATQSRTWAAALAAGMFGGAFFMELFFDTYQAAICGLALVLPLVLTAAEMLRTRRRADVVLCALIVSGFLTVYPLFMPLVVLALVLVFAALALGRRLAREPIKPFVLPLALTLLATGALASLFEPVAFVRDIHYAVAIIRNTIPLPRVGFTLPLSVLPGWLLQTREFWSMPPLGHADAEQLLVGLVLPLGFIVVICAGLWRHRQALVLVALAVACGLVADYAYTSRQACTYCAERDLLPVAPIAAALLALGVYTLVAWGDRRLRRIGFAAALVIVIAVAQRTHVELRRFSGSAYFLDSANRQVLSKLPPGASVQLEGYDASYQAQAEEGYVFFLAEERSHGHASLITTTDPYQGLAYLTFYQANVPSQTFNPDYQYVLTRLAGIDSGRRVIARSGAVALEQRAPLDVIPVSGITQSLVRVEPEGVGWVQPSTPLVLDVTGQTNATRVWVHLMFQVSVRVSVPRQHGVTAVGRGSTLSVCVPATGSSPLRTAKVQISGALVPGVVPPGEYPPPVPAQGIALIGARAQTGSCSA